LVFAIYSLAFYFTSYYKRFPVFYAKAWRAEDKELSLFIKEHGSRYDKIIFDSNSGFVYTSLLFYLPQDPLEFQNTVRREPDDSEGFSRVLSFGKFEFKSIDWNTDYRKKNVLLVTTPDKKPADVPPLKTFYYPVRPVVVSVKQEIVQYPIQEIAYVLVESSR
jgi:hypothetical protein